MLGLKLCFTASELSFSEAASSSFGTPAFPVFPPQGLGLRVWACIITPSYSYCFQEALGSDPQHTGKIWVDSCMAAPAGVYRRALLAAREAERGEPQIQ